MNVYMYIYVNYIPYMWTQFTMPYFVRVILLFLNRFMEKYINIFNPIQIWPLTAPSAARVRYQTSFIWVQKCCALKPLSCWVPAKILHTWYTSAKKADVFLCWMTFAWYLSVFQNVYPVQFNLPISQHVKEEHINLKNIRNILSLWHTDLRIRVFTIYVDVADHMTKSDLIRKFEMTTMSWFSRGVLLGMWESRDKWNILKMPIKH